jgi:uncharacterized metal-binding protein YceD (DUF177 family)
LPSAPQSDHRGPLTKAIGLEEIKGDISGSFVASPAERGAMAALLELPELAAVRFDYTVRRGGGGRHHLSGRLTADVTQTCVVTLEPVQGRVDVPVDVEFWPERLLAELEARAEEGASDPDAEWPEPIIEGKIDIGPVIYETLATSLDPYPRREGASFEWADAPEPKGEVEKSSPFAALERLKRP